MDKCWFVLRQAHYPAPEYSDSNIEGGAASGCLLLGHIIPSLKRLDQVINTEGPLPFPKDMSVRQTTLCDFQWTTSKDSGLYASAKADVPVATAAGVSVQSDIETNFHRTTADAWQFDRIDTQIITPTRNYINQCLRVSSVANHIEREQTRILHTWKLFMISGIMIVRGGSSERSVSRETSSLFKPALKMADVISTEIGAGVSNTAHTTLSGRHANDFIWAVRLTEISKSIFRPGVSEMIVTKGATLGLNKSSPAITDVLDAAGLTDYETFDHKGSEDDKNLYFIFTKNEEA